MGQCIIMTGGYTGNDSDDCTAVRSQVLTGYKAITKDSDDEVIAGTMSNRGAWNGSVGMNSQIVVPEGYHNGRGKVSGPSVPYQNADVSGTDRARATQRSCWDGTINLGVRNGYYLNGVNWIQHDDLNFCAANIKKGVSIMGITGTFEGYVPTPSDLYLRGNNIVNFQHSDSEGKGTVKFDSGQITVTTSSNFSVATMSATFSTVGYNYLNIESYVVGPGYSASGKIELYRTEPSFANIVSVDVNWQATGNKTFSLNIGGYNISSNFKFYMRNGNLNIYRIWLS